MFGCNSLFLFTGDSITDAGRDRMNNSSMGQGYPNIISGDLFYNEPKKLFKFINKGISGNRIVDLYARWKEDCINIKPDIISIMIGVNDVWHEFSRNSGVELEKFITVYDLLLTETKTKLPNAKIILCEPFALKASATENNYDIWRSELSLRQDAVSKMSKKHGCVLVQLQKPFDDACAFAPPQYWLPDGVHPSPAGHTLISKEWIKKMEVYP